MNNLFSFSSIRGKIAFWLFSISFVLLMIASAIMYTMHVKSIKKEAVSKLTAIRDLKISQINNWIEERTGDLEVIAESQTAINFFSTTSHSHEKTISRDQRNKANQFLSHYILSYDAYDEIYFSDINSGIILFSTNHASEGKNISKEVFFSNVHKSDMVYIDDIHLSDVSAKPTMSFNKVIKSHHNSKKSIGIVTAIINLEGSLYKLLRNRTGLGETGETFIINHSAYALSELKNHQDAPLKLKISAQPTQLSAKGVSGIIEAEDYMGVKILAAFNYLPKTAWGFVAKQDQSEIYASIESILKKLIILITLSIPIIYFISLFIANTITRPILRLSQKSTDLMDGKLVASSQIIGKDEIAALERNFDSMAENIQHYLAQLQESEDRLRQVAENVKDVFWLLDVKSNKLVYVSPNYENTMGKSIESLCEGSTEWLDSVHIEDKEQICSARSSLKNYKVEYRIQQTDGSTIWFQEQSFQILNKNEEVYRKVGVATDITNLKENQILLEQAKNEAESANKAKSMFLANMSHEIRTPLNAIIGYGHLLKNAPLNSLQLEQLAKQSDSANHLLQIINDILDLSKIDAGMMILHDEDIDIEQLLTKVCSFVQNKASHKNIELFLDFDHVPCFLIGDGLRIEQVLLNLVSNAVKFTEQGSVCIKLNKLEEFEQSLRIRFEVIDTGIGVSSDVVSKIFEGFEQADSSVTRQFGGTGLGLTISKKIINLLHGEIGITSNQGEGSTFWFEVILKKSLLIKKNSISLRKLAHKRALVVDDLFEARETLFNMLTQMNINAKTASSGIAAIHLISKADQEGVPFHVILLDWKMPMMDGIETATKILALSLNHMPKIIFITACGQMMDQLEIAHLTSKVITKPITPSTLQDALVTLFFNKDITTYKPYQENQISMVKFHDVHILLVEDNSINQDVALYLLENAGIQVDLAENGQIAYDMAEKNQYDLILMDIQMPVLDGFKATLAIRKLPHYKMIPILAMTANAFDEDKEQCLKVGMNAHIAKPVSPSLLFKTLADFLPKDKIVLEDYEQAKGDTLAEESLPNKENIIEQLNSFDGFDAQLGLRSVGGNCSHYLRLLKKFPHQYKEKFSNILNAPSDNHQKAIQHLAHTLKGSAATLGVINIWILAKDLEEVATNKTASKQLILQTRQLKDELKKLEQFINPVLEKVELSSEHLTLDKQNIYTVIKKLETLLETDDAETNRLFEDSRELLKQAFGTATESLEQQINNFDYSGALQTLLSFDLDSLK